MSTEGRIGEPVSEAGELPFDTELSPLPLAQDRLEGVPGVLGQIARERAKDYEEYRPQSSRPIYRAQRDSFAAALGGAGLAIIAEIKQASPSLGRIASLDPATAATAYLRGGASALSVLTEPRHFGGALGHIREASVASGLPILRKDFTVHPGQIHEARIAGASAVLLIAALTGDSTSLYLEYARRLGLDALVEVHDEAELELALRAGAEIVGVNNRDLRTLRIDLDTAPRLMSMARECGFEGLLVAESGYRSSEELRELEGVADAVLIGTSLAGSGDLELSLRRLTGVDVER